jgi:pimeloyl-ACP methyl ester carboxylesterase
MLKSGGRLLLLVGLLLSCAMLPGCAMSPSSGVPTLKTEEFMLPAQDAGIQLYVRNKLPAEMKAFSPEKTVLFVHGATYPSEVVFDLGVGEGSWMEYIARHGYDVYLLDVRGYGRSTRPQAMSEAPEQNPPFARTQEAVADIAVAVDFILQRRGITKLNLIGWSWGTTTTASFSTREPQKVAKLVMHAPVWTPPQVADPPVPVPTAAYRSVTLAAARQRWYARVPEDKQAALVPSDWFDTWGRALLASDPEGSRQDPPAARAPNGVLADILGEWLRGRRLYDASLVRAPTLIIKGDWDVDTPAAMAQGLFASLSNAPFKSYIEIGEGTHMLMLEKNRMRLFREVQAFLDDPQI